LLVAANEATMKPVKAWIYLTCFTVLSLQTLSHEVSRYPWWAKCGLFSKFMSQVYDTKRHPT